MVNAASGVLSSSHVLSHVFAVTLTRTHFVIVARILVEKQCDLMEEGISLRRGSASARALSATLTRLTQLRSHAAGDMNFDDTPTKLTVHLDRPGDRLRPRCTDASARRFRNRRRTGF